MAGKNTAVFGIYRAYADVEQGVDALKSAGFRNTDISVLMPENVGTKAKLTEHSALSALWREAGVLVQRRDFD